jgi:hypothetical protein
MLALVLVMAPVAARAAIVAWTGTGGTSWATTNSWSPTGSGPGTSDTASFTNTGSVTFPGTVTSVLNTNRTIGGLVFVESSGDYQTLDFGGFTLTDNGNLSLNTDENSATTTVLRDGILNVNSTYSSVYVGSGVSSSAIGTADLSGLTSFGATVENFYVGSSTSSGSVTGTLTLSPSNSINAQLVQIGGEDSSGNANGTLHLGLSNAIATPEFDVGLGAGNGTVTIASGGTLSLGSSSARTLLQIANNGDLSQNNTFIGNLNLSGGNLNAYVSSLIVGQNTNNVDASGTFTTGAGVIDIGPAGNTANFYVGNSAYSSGTASGTVNFSALTTLNANLNSLAIGTTATGNATGVVTLAASNTINANTITVGSNGVANTGSGTLTLGNSNTILTNQFIVGQNFGGGTVTLPAGGSLSLGSPAQMTALAIANGDLFYNNNQYSGMIDLSKGSFTGYLSSLTVGQQTGSGDTMNGTFYAGDSGSVVIGAAGTNTANIVVGNASSAGTGNGTVSFGGLNSLTANLNTFTIGTSASSGSATGNVTLAASNIINANSVSVGIGDSSGTLTLGKTNTILANQFTITQNSSNGTVTLPGGGSLNLGSPTQMTALTIANGNLIYTNNAYAGLLDLSQGTFNGYLSSLIVGQQTGSGDTMNGTFNAGNGGSVQIGAAGTDTANIIVGNAPSGGTANGTVNFGGLNSLTANLNLFTIGTVGTDSTSESATGAVTLAASNTISANSITVGSSGGGTDTLALGLSNTILANQFTIGQDYSNGAVTITSGGSLTLGSPSSPLSLTIAQGTTTSTANYSGSLKLTNATLTAYLANVIVGNETSSGTETGTLTISSNPANYIVANSITLGGTKSTGTLNYGGGSFYAGSIAAGAGTANFNWTGGTLSVGTFGTPTIPFNLNNTGTGTLAPATASGAIGTNTINGNYTQGSSATTAIRIAGDSAGTGNDQVNISGSASLAGNLDLSLIDGFIPAVGENFLIETYGSHSGSYSYVAPPTLPQNVAFLLDYTTSPTQLMVRMVTPVPQNYTSTASVGSFGTASSWDTDTTPGTANNVTINNTGTTAQTVTVATSTTVQGINLSGSGAPLNLEIPQGISPTFALR